jgi:LysM repeat protein
MVRVRVVASVLLLLMAIPTLASVPKSSSRPPRDLHRVGDHWTAYNPPDSSTYPADAKTHTVVAGDTLWALAKQYYGSPYLWPQLWEANTWIRDARWIYPGDVLHVTGDVQAPMPESATETTASSSELGGGSMSTAGTSTDSGMTVAETVKSTRPLPLGTETDVYCYGYIGDPNEPMPNWISSFEDVEVLYQPGAIIQVAGVTQGDLVFVDGGTSTGLVAGETYMVISPGDTIKHPATGEVIGRQYDFQGQIKILCADETTARGQITQSCREILVGSRLKPMPQLPIPIARIPDMPTICDEPEITRSGVIIDSQGWDLALGEGTLVQINLGSDQEVQPGDFFVIYRDSPVKGQPRQVLGELGILTTEARTSTARIVQMRRTMQIGDIVEPR